jgi:hypothetical protein
LRQGHGPAPNGSTVSTDYSPSKTKRLWTRIRMGLLFSLPCTSFETYIRGMSKYDYSKEHSEAYLWALSEHQRIGAPAPSAAHASFLLRLNIPDFTTLEPSRNPVGCTKSLRLSFYLTVNRKRKRDLHKKWPSIAMPKLPPGQSCKRACAVCGTGLPRVLIKSCEYSTLLERFGSTSLSRLSADLLREGSTSRHLVRGWGQRMEGGQSVVVH